MTVYELEQLSDQIANSRGSKKLKLKRTFLSKIRSWWETKRIKRLVTFTRKNDQELLDQVGEIIDKNDELSYTLRSLERKGIDIKNYNQISDQLNDDRRTFLALEDKLNKRIAKRVSDVESVSEYAINSDLPEYSLEELDYITDNYYMERDVSGKERIYNFATGAEVTDSELNNKISFAKVWAFAFSTQIDKFYEFAFTNPIAKRLYKEVSEVMYSNEEYDRETIYNQLMAKKFSDFEVKVLKELFAIDSRFFKIVNYFNGMKAKGISVPETEPEVDINSFTRNSDATASEDNNDTVDDGVNAEDEENEEQVEQSIAPTDESVENTEETDFAVSEANDENVDNSYEQEVEEKEETNKENVRQTEESNDVSVNTSSRENYFKTVISQTTDRINYLNQLRSKAVLENDQAGIFNTDTEINSLMQMRERCQAKLDEITSSAKTEEPVLAQESNIIREEPVIERVEEPTSKKEEEHSTSGDSLVKDLKTLKEEIGSLRDEINRYREENASLKEQLAASEKNRETLLDTVRRLINSPTNEAAKSMGGN